MKETRDTLRANLTNSGLDPKLFPPEKLLYWLQQPRTPILVSRDGLAKLFVRAMLTGETVNFVYVGGSQPGAPRSIKVSFVFRLEPDGRIYVAGYCPERAANRVFALDLIMLIHGWN